MFKKLNQYVKYNFKGVQYIVKFYYDPQSESYNIGTVKNGIPTNLEICDEIGSTKEEQKIVIETINIDPNGLIEELLTSAK